MLQIINSIACFQEATCVAGADLEENAPNKSGLVDFVRKNENMRRLHISVQDN